ncbi:MAG: hypothetical protein LBV12_01845, partial [Puniceicoccales bacterium]|nr:hypothetical protein [Puniceicoccales bacterium]
MKLLPVVQTILIALALAPVATSAQTVSEVISGDLTIERDLYVSRDILVGSAILDNSTETWPAYSLKADSVMGNTYIDEFAYGRITTWTWNIQHNGYLPRRVMALDST